MDDVFYGLTRWTKTRDWTKTHSTPFWIKWMKLKFIGRFISTARKTIYTNSFFNEDEENGNLWKMDYERRLTLYCVDVDPLSLLHLPSPPSWKNLQLKSSRIRKWKISSSNTFLYCITKRNEEGKKEWIQIISIRTWHFTCKAAVRVEFLRQKLSQWKWIVNVIELEWKQPRQWIRELKCA